MKELQQQKTLIDAVVISGGEPTLPADILPFTTALKREEFYVKLDTNGTRPDVLAALIKAKLVDYIAMDIKAPFEKYASVCLRNVDLQAIKRSIDIITKADVDYEFRTTFAPDITLQDLGNISQEILINAKHYSVNAYVKPPLFQGFYDERLLRPPHSDAELKQAQAIAAKGK